MEDARLFCTPHPFYWDLLRDKDGFKLSSSCSCFQLSILTGGNSFAVPGSHLGIGMVGETAKLRPLYADSFTRLHLLENSEATVAEVRRGNFLKTVALNRGDRRPITSACLLC